MQWNVAEKIQRIIHFSSTKLEQQTFHKCPLGMNGQERKRVSEWMSGGKNFLGKYEHKCQLTNFVVKSKPQDLATT